MPPDDTPNLKTCAKCGEAKPATIDYYPIYKHYRLDNICRACDREQRRLWRSVNRARHNAANRTYSLINREKERVRKKYWREHNRAKANQQAIMWRKNNPDKARAIIQRRHARLRSLPATLTLQEWETIKAEFEYRCAYCGKAWFEIDGILEQEHIIPIAQGGGYTKENIVPACGACNRRKQGRTPEQAGMQIFRPQSVL